MKQAAEAQASVNGTKFAMQHFAKFAILSRRMQCRLSSSAPFCSRYKTDLFGLSCIRTLTTGDSLREHILFKADFSIFSKILSKLASTQFQNYLDEQNGSTLKKWTDAYFKIWFLSFKLSLKLSTSFSICGEASHNAKGQAWRRLDCTFVCFLRRFLRKYAKFL